MGSCAICGKDYIIEDLQDCEQCGKSICPDCAVSINNDDKIICKHCADREPPDYDDEYHGEDRGYN